MGRSRKDRPDIVLFLGRHGADALSAAPLGTVFADRQALDVSAVSQGKDTFFFFDEVFQDDLVIHILDFCFPLVAKLVTDGDQLVF